MIKLEMLKSKEKETEIFREGDSIEFSTAYESIPLCAEEIAQMCSCKATPIKLFSELFNDTVTIRVGSRTYYATPSCPEFERCDQRMVIRKRWVWDSTGSATGNFSVTALVEARGSLKEQQAKSWKIMQLVQSGGLDNAMAQLRECEASLEAVRYGKGEAPGKSSEELPGHGGGDHSSPHAGHEELSRATRVFAHSNYQESCGTEQSCLASGQDAEAPSCAEELYLESSCPEDQVLLKWRQAKARVETLRQDWLKCMVFKAFEHLVQPDGEGKSRL